MGVFPTEVVSRANSMARLKTEKVRINVGIGVKREKRGRGVDLLIDRIVFVDARVTFSAIQTACQWRT